MDAWAMGGGWEDGWVGGWMDEGMRAMRAIEVFGSRPRRRAMPREGPDRSHVWPLRHHCHPMDDQIHATIHEGTATLVSGPGPFLWRPSHPSLTRAQPRQPRGDGPQGHEGPRGRLLLIGQEGQEGAEGSCSRNFSMSTRAWSNWSWMEPACPRPSMLRAFVSCLMVKYFSAPSNALFARTLPLAGK